MALGVWVLFSLLHCFFVSNVSADTNRHFFPIHDHFSATSKSWLIKLWELILSHSLRPQEFSHSLRLRGVRLNPFTSKVLSVVHIITSASVCFASPCERVASSPAPSAGWEREKNYKGQDVWVGSVHLGTNKQSILLHLLCGDPLIHEGRIIVALWASLTSLRSLLKADECV